MAWRDVTRRENMTLLHTLPEGLPRPRRMNNPFYYEPDAVAGEAMNQLKALLRGEAVDGWLPLDSDFLAESGQGKMFGVLVVENEGKLYFLAGYSGQICGRSDWPQFVPAVVDYLQPDGYFKTHERQIVEVNREIEQLAQSDERQQLLNQLEQTRLQGEEETEAFRQHKWEAKAQRDARRAQAQTSGKPLSETEIEKMTTQSQWEKAELRRIKKRWRERESEIQQQVDEIDCRIDLLRRQRRNMSDHLQQWLFSQFDMFNAEGNHLTLPDIFSAFGDSHGEPGMVPPSGTGECCEPRLLQQAYKMKLRPVSIAMFWWGESPRDEVRHSGQCYPACRSKCRPLLWWMLRGLDVEPSPLDLPSHHQLQIVYEDEDITVVCKPSGMLSVPGKSHRESVESVMRERLGIVRGPVIVHRLDMDTSGLMVVAHNAEAYHNLQTQFATRQVHKRYEALLERPLNRKEGVIRLPLRPDVEDRPRQLVDFEYGKPAVTRFRSMGDCRVSLWPETGRTHQLRVHCAHKLGLNNPIQGDDLYGSRGVRLCLHAAELTFRHPRTGKLMTFHADVPF